MSFLTIRRRHLFIVILLVLLGAIGQGITRHYVHAIKPRPLDTTKFSEVSVGTVGHQATYINGIMANNSVSLAETVTAAAPNAGSVLVFPYYTSTADATKNTTMSLSNIGTQPAILHVFGIVNCGSADNFLTLAPNASYSISAAAYDPGSTGYLIAVAVDDFGIPIQNNNLTGQAVLKDGDYVGTYEAEVFKANAAAPATSNGNGTATLHFDGTRYDQMPNQFSVNIQSPVDVTGQKVITVGLQGNLTTGALSGAAQVGTGLVRKEFGFSSFVDFLTGQCQAMATISTSNPRVPGGLAFQLPSGQTGTLRFGIGGGVGLSLKPSTALGGASIQSLPKTGFTNATLTIPMGAPANTLVVTVTDDIEDGVCNAHCSLRDAIMAANARPGADTIVFNLGVGTPVIRTTGYLPIITDPVVINGNTGGATRVELNLEQLSGGETEPGALTVIGGNSTISGLVIGGYLKPGIVLQGNGGNTIKNCYIGTNASGTAAQGNTGAGIFINGVPNNIIGGTTANERNVISGNTSRGVFISGPTASGNKISGNYIGTDASGSADLGNGSQGVFFSLASGNTIGGTTVGERNIISGNDAAGIDVSGASNNKIIGNYIGTDVTGTVSLENEGYGILVVNSQETIIGGILPAERNVISGNNGLGISLTTSTIVTTGSSNKVIGNYIGINAAGTANLGNSSDGISMDGSSSTNTIGGATAEARNVIAGNGRYGVAISGSSTGNIITGNYIGMSANGAAVIGNKAAGVYILNSPNNLIGGPAAGQRNVISGNKQQGILISGTTATGNKVMANHIGTDVSGTNDLGNSFGGIEISGAPNNVLGGATAGEGNVISGNDSGGVYILNAGATGNKVIGNFIGTDVSGLIAVGNRNYGVRISDAPTNTIGGTTTSERNIISGNIGTGINISNSNATGNRVLGNYIGLNVNGTLAIANTSSGITLTASENFIGGTASGARNLISGNGLYGISIQGASSFQPAQTNKVIANYIGTDVTGTLDRGNGYDGIYFGLNARFNTIGGSMVAERNVLSGNDRCGVYIFGTDAASNRVLGNFIGTDANGGAALGNTLDGVRIERGVSNAIGGRNAGEGNVISGNNLNGITLLGNATDTIENRLLGNSIFSNAKLGIDLGNDGVTNNDALDADAGPNNRQNFPLLTSATSLYGQTHFRGTLNSLANTRFRIEFFSNDGCDESGNGEGKIFFGSVDVLTNGAGDVTINTTIEAALAAGKFVTATATRLNAAASPLETSEFSSCRIVRVPTLTIDDVSTVEGTALVFSVTLSDAQDSDTPIIVNYESADAGFDNSATAGSDYTAVAGRMEFRPSPLLGTISRPLSIPITQDSTVEPDEKFFVQLFGVAGAVIVKDKGIGTILNDDRAAITITDVSMTEGNTGTTNATFMVNLSAPVDKGFSVNFATADGTATVANGDYMAATGTINFPANSSSSIPITVVVNGDKIVEPDEFFIVNLPAVALPYPTVTIVDNQGRGTIRNDDVLTLSIDDVTVTEGNSGTTNAIFTVSLSGTSATPITVSYTLANDTATVADNDYAFTGGMLTFPANSTAAQTITVAVKGDTKVELDEKFFVRLSNAVGATVSKIEGIGTIRNDDETTLSINDARVTEGDSVTSEAIFTVSLSNPSAFSIPVQLMVTNGTAMPPDDYPNLPLSISFSPGEQSKTISVNVNGDTLVEADETFSVAITPIGLPPTGITIAKGIGEGTIVNDDFASIEIRDAVVTEGNNGTANATFTVTLNALVDQLVVVNYATADDSATTANNDYSSAQGTITFNPPPHPLPPNFSHSQTITVTVNGDTLTEINETFRVSLSPGFLPHAGVTIADDLGIGTIVNDDTNTCPASNGAAVPLASDVATTYSGVSGCGVTMAVPIDTSTTEPLPTGYSIEGLDLKYEITTTAAYTGPIVMTFKVPNTVTAEQFARLRILHGENGQLVDRTILAPNSPAPNFATREISARVTSLSPFVIALAPLPQPPIVAGSVLVFPLYTSEVNNFAAANTRLNFTNIDPTRLAYVHVFFISKQDCTVADTILCLTPNQTASFLASDFDPGTTGYVIAVAVDARGCPINFNFLMGSEFVKLASGHAANLQAQAIAALPTGVFTCNPADSSATLKFDGVQYSLLPHTLAVNNLPSPLEGNDTLLILDRIGGDLNEGEAARLSNLAGLVYNDRETGYSFVQSAAQCQLIQRLQNGFPRTSPPLGQIIPVGRSGWLRFNQSDNGAMIGAMINLNPKGFNQGHYLHVLRFTSATLTIPVYGPTCVQ